ncbi:hypothetical protein [Arthrobacter psychrolactophilus]|uniref:hypothetical protein n=1 Tax=Arthrobacter psychrolactophilus TaxID=92442 RepID=UPI0011B49455|nr:hypothetical protein [Arthrobacter psychrolactophilus]
MSKQGFDARYPAMFQPGGEQSTTPEPPTAALAPVPLPAQVAQPEPQIVQARAAHPAEKHPELIWRRPLALAVACLVAAVFCFMAQYWLDVSISFEESAAFGWMNQQWPNLIFPATSPLLAAGISLIVMWLWMGSRRTAMLEARYRAVFRHAAVGLLLFGLFARFCQQLFPAPLSPVMVVDAETGMPVRYLLSQPWPADRWLSPRYKESSWCRVATSHTCRRGPRSYSFSCSPSSWPPWRSWSSRLFARSYDPPRHSNAKSSARTLFPNASPPVQSVLRMPHRVRIEACRRVDS